MTCKNLLWFSAPTRMSDENTFVMSKDNLTHIIFEGNDITEKAISSFPEFEFELDIVHVSGRDKFCVGLDEIGEVALFGKRIKWITS